MKKYEAAVASGNMEAAEATYTATVKKIDQAVAKGVYKKNTVSRKKSQLAKALAALA